MARPPDDDLVGMWSWAPGLVEARHPAAIENVHTMAILYSLEHVREMDAWDPASLDRGLDGLARRTARVGR